MDVQRGSEARFERGDEARFSGEVWLRGGRAAPDGTNIGLVHFSPAARTHWHRHPGGQFLYALQGRGRVRSRDEEGHLLQPGDVVYVPAGEWHFHGADADAPLVHLAVNGQGTPEWGEPVTELDYGEGF